MKILAFDASTQQCSAALSYHGEIKTRSQYAPNQHAELLLPLIQELLNEADLSLSQINVIGFGRGPGSFTGLRIAASLAQGLACAHDIPVAPISTLQALAQAAYHTHQVTHVAAAIDARIQQIYWGTYLLNKHGVMQLDNEECVIDPDKAQLTNKHWSAIGSGWSIYQKQLVHLQPFITFTDANAVPEAYTLTQLARFYFEQNLVVSAENALPIYLRDKVC